MDRYTKIVLTLIAFALWAQLLAGLVQPGHGLISQAQAQVLGSYQRVVIAGYEINGGAVKEVPLPVAAAQAMPIYFTPGATTQQSYPMPVNLVGLNGQALQGSTGLPVNVLDVAAVGGASVRSAGGVPVAPGAKPLAVSVPDPLPVAVKTMPVSAAVSQQSPASSSTSTSSPGSRAPGG